MLATMTRPTSYHLNTTKVRATDSRLGGEDGVAVDVCAKSNLDEVVGGEDVGRGGLVGRGRREVLEGAVDGEAGRERDAF